MHVIDTRGPGGAESVYIGLINELPRDQFTSFAIVSGNGYVYDKLKENDSLITVIPSKGSFNVKSLYRLISFVKKHKINIIQSHLFGSSVYCSIVGLVCRIPVISTFHGFVDTSNYSKFNLLKFRIINRWTSHIVFVSNSLKKQFISEFSLSNTKCFTIYNGIDKNIFNLTQDKSLRVNYRISDNNILVGSVGNIRPAKGYEILLKAAAKVIKKVPECRFMIAGQGSGILLSELKKLRADLNLENVVFFIGYHDNVSKFYANIDIFVSSSLSEGFSLSTVEAMACKLPIVVTKSGGPEEIIRDYKSGLIVQAGCVDALADAIVKFVKNSALRDECIKGGESDLSKFLFKSTVENYSQIYKRALSEM